MSGVSPVFSFKISNTNERIGTALLRSSSGPIGVTLLLPSRLTKPLMREVINQGATSDSHFLDAE